MWRKVECDSCHKHFCGKCGQQPHSNQPGQNVTCEAFARWMVDNENMDESLRDYLKTTRNQKCPNCKAVAELVSGGCK